LLINDGFEQGTFGWFAINSTLAHDTTVSYRGQASARQQPNGADPAAITSTATSDSPRVYAGQEYFFSAWVRTAVGHQVEMSVTWRRRDSTLIQSVFLVPPVVVPGGEWTQLVGSAVAPEGAFRAQWLINQRGTPSTTDLLWIDEAVMSDGAVLGADSPNRVDTRGSSLVRPAGEAGRPRGQGRSLTE
jgi:hypothetical protein